MIELSRTQDEEVGDGTTSVIVLGMSSLKLVDNCSFFDDLLLVNIVVGCTIINSELFMNHKNEKLL